MTKNTSDSKEIIKAIKRTRAAYQATALAYEKVSMPFHIKVIYPRIISIIQDHLGSLKGKEILDVGCGSGMLMQILEKRGANCCGIEITPVFIELVRSRGLHVISASMHKLPFSDERFDAIISNYALNYLPPKGQLLAIQEKFRALKPGGIMVFTYMHPFLMRMSRYQETPPHYLSIVKDYFQPQRQQIVDLLGQKFTLYLLDWPEIVQMVVGCGFRLRDLIDAEFLKGIEKMATSIKDKAAAHFARSLRYTPYGIFVVATKT